MTRADALPVRLRPPDPETVLPDPVTAARTAIEDAATASGAERIRRFRDIARRWPRTPAGWAGLAGAESDLIARYAYARTGYHRGLDALRAAGWKGSGSVPWRAPSNRWFLRCVELLRCSALEIGEDDEAQRCALFLRQLDPKWPPVELADE